MLAAAGLDQRNTGGLDHPDHRADQVGAARKPAVDGSGEQQALVSDDIDQAARFDEHPADHRINVFGITRIGEQPGSGDAAGADEAADRERAGAPQTKAATVGAGRAGGSSRTRSAGRTGRASRTGSADGATAADTADAGAARRFAGRERKARRDKDKMGGTKFETRERHETSPSTDLVPEYRIDMSLESFIISDS